MRSDHELLVAARTDPEAFGEFYRRHAIGVERWLRAQTPDLATAADLTAETFAQALVSLKRFRGASDEQAVGWLFGIARNLVRRYRRRGRAWSLRSAAGSASSLTTTRTSSPAWRRRLTHALTHLSCPML
jgi:DNA-directed RNA polymerase specialized sigma24 family protein